MKTVGIVFSGLVLFLILMSGRGSPAKLVVLAIGGIGAAIAESMK